MTGDEQARCERCGAVLSRYNSAGVCAGCGRVKPSAPDGFWERPEIRDALAAWDMGTVVRAFRQCTGLSQAAVARLVNIDQAEVSRLERGRKRLRDRRQVLTWTRALNIPDGRIDAFPVTGGGSVSSLSALHRAGFTVDDMGAGPATPRAWDADERVDELLIDLQRRDNACGADALLAGAARSLQAVVRRLDRGGANASEPNLYSAAAQLAQMVGWLSLDAGRPADARQNLSLALYCAHTVGDLRLAGSVLGYLSLTSLYHGPPAEALALARTAQDTARGTVGGPVGAMLATRRARAHAAQGDDAECRSALREAERHGAGHPEAAPAPAWIDYFDAAELRAQQGTCLMQIGELDEAEVHLGSALALRRRLGSAYLRDQVNYGLRLAEIALSKGELDVACARAQAAFSAHREISSTRMASKLSTFAGQLTPYRSHAGVSDLIAAMKGSAS
ncbi:helix-turn-helix domain-containing protein [Streptomyces sp. LX-29]|uniref:helix-turn-helix domain-containing protein n=1 Tax=Streptomyces sp. LX-29 TaxID=2900152 RepID=UPI00240DF2D7|nr:helix-turn-helix domain-containing protein [Streptomyces sp. LX-29]WFB11709.1 helix-turn-helix domain-containing protein [Streptomyces sp. LX-29]